MKRKPAEQKILQDTNRPDRDRPNVYLAILHAAPDPPEYLSPTAETEWRRIAPEVVRVGVTLADLRALALLCESLATESALRAVIDQEGTTIAAGSGGRKSHPALAALAQCRSQAHKLLSDFGLIPRGRISLPAAPNPKPKGPDKFRGIGARPR